MLTKQARSQFSPHNNSGAGGVGRSRDVRDPAHFVPSSPLLRQEAFSYDVYYMQYFVYVLCCILAILSVECGRYMQGCKKDVVLDKQQAAI